MKYEGLVQLTIHLLCGSTNSQVVINDLGRIGDRGVMVRFLVATVHEIVGHDLDHD